MLPILLKLPYSILACMLLMVLANSCDGLSESTGREQGMDTLSQNIAEKEENPTIAADPKALLTAYFEALKQRDHQQLKSLLHYSNNFFLDEPQSITKWELMRVEELTSEEADNYDFKPNPIKNDLLLYVKINTIDEYKKRSWVQRYFIRENKQRWGFVNRIGADTCSGIFLKYGEFAIDFKEYPVAYQRENQYLVRISEREYISVDEKTRVLGTYISEKDCKFSFRPPTDIFCNDSEMANWAADGSIESLNPTKTDIAQDSLKTE